MEPRSIEEWTATEDLKHRVWALRASVERYLGLQRAVDQALQAISANPSGWTGFTRPQQRLNSEKDAQIEAMLNQAVALTRALRSKDLPAGLSGRSLGSMTEPIKHVRNIREHWNENRPFWSSAQPIPSDRKFASARWFKAHHPDKTPWSSSWSNIDGSVVCGIIRLDQLLAVLSELEALIPAND